LLAIVDGKNELKTLFSYFKGQITFATYLK
jgi:hypothetical protein